MDISSLIQAFTRCYIAIVYEQLNRRIARSISICLCMSWAYQWAYQNSAFLAALDRLLSRINLLQPGTQRSFAQSGTTRAHAPN
jgi:hypothetical protein